MYNHIFWDFDGTLFDSYPMMSKAFRMMLKEKGVDEPEEAIEGLMRRSWAEAKEHYIMKYGVTEDDVIRYNTIRAIEENANCAPFAAAEKLCHDIFGCGKKNYMYTHRGRSTAIYLDKFGLTPIFADSVTATDGFARKPSPQGMLYLLQRHGINPEEAIMIGDRDLDMLAAKGAGMSACLFDEKNSLSIGAADYIITDFTQLYPILGIDK